MKSVVWVLSGAVLLLAACGNPAASGGASNGSAEFVVVIIPAQPLSVELAADPEGALPPGQDFTVTAAVSGGSGQYSYRWYLDGQLLAGQTDAVIALGSELDPAFYYLTLVVTDGAAASSATATFAVMQ